MVQCDHRFLRRYRQRTQLRLNALMGSIQTIPVRTGTASIQALQSGQPSTVQTVFQGDLYFSFSRFAACQKQLKFSGSLCHSITTAKIGPKLHFRAVDNSLTRRNPHIRNPGKEIISQKSVAGLIFSLTVSAHRPRDASVFS